MCVNCVSNFEATAAKVALVGVLLKGPAHHALAALGLVDPPDPVRRDARTVAFLRDLELDPVEILGAEAVARADAWLPQPCARRSWALPIGSQSLPAAT